MIKNLLVLKQKFIICNNKHVHMDHSNLWGLSVVTDTAPKKNRKERMESKMKQLERDIETIEKHKIIYIAN